MWGLRPDVVFVVGTWGWYHKSSLSSLAKIFLLSVPRRYVFCWSFSLFMFRASHAVMSVHCSLVVTVLLGNDSPLGSLVCGVFLCFVTFPWGVLGQVRYLIVTITYLCLLPYFLSHSVYINLLQKKADFFKFEQISCYILDSDITFLYCQLRYM